FAARLRLRFATTRSRRSRRRRRNSAASARRRSGRFSVNEPTRLEFSEWCEGATLKRRKRCAPVPTTCGCTAVWSAVKKSKVQQREVTEKTGESLSPLPPVQKPQRRAVKPDDPATGAGSACSTRANRENRASSLSPRLCVL